jgi:hypothetical protein
MFSYQIIVFLFAIVISFAKKFDPKVDLIEEMKNFRHVRYCEILSSRNKFGWNSFFEFTAYNSLLYGCPQEKWAGITESMIRNMDNSYLVKLNGPRFWVFDTVAEGSTLVDSTVTVINDIPMVVVGLVQSSLYEVLISMFMPHAKVYSEREVKRKTEYIFRAGLPVYYLESPTGATYAMQSYCTKVFDVHQNNLHQLGSLLTLPTGWTYNVIIVKKDFHLIAINAIGVIINDDFFNVYSKFDKQILETAMISDDNNKGISIVGDSISIATAADEL